MPKLIHLRLRIKAIETIKKVTHAMRLIAISSHSHLKIQKQSLLKYTESIQHYIHIVHPLAPSWHNTFGNHNHHQSKKLIILVGSQKGLCGTFNQTLFNSFTTTKNDFIDTSYHLITIGKKASDFIQQTTPHLLIQQYDTFNRSTLFVIAKEITTQLTNKNTPYTTVLIWSNMLRTFFIQKPTRSVLIPFDTTDQTSYNNTTQTLPEDYLWEFNASELLEQLTSQYLEARIQLLLLESLLAEQAARFLSMDSATRNAQRLSDSTKLQYNKLRQAKITREITELSGSI